MSATNATIEYLSTGTLDASMNTSILGTLGVTGFTTLTDSSMNNLSVTGYISAVNVSATNATMINLSVNTLYINGLKYDNSKNIDTITFTNISVTGTISTTNISSTNASINNLSVSNIYMVGTSYPILDKNSIGYLNTSNRNTSLIGANVVNNMTSLSVNSGVWIFKGHATFLSNISWGLISISNSSTTIDYSNSNQCRGAANVSIGLNSTNIAYVTNENTSFYLLALSPQNSSVTNISLLSLRIA